MGFGSDFVDAAVSAAKDALGLSESEENSIKKSGRIKPTPGMTLGDFMESTSADNEIAKSLFNPGLLVASLSLGT